jgi:hypothetical protein
MCVYVKYISVYVWVYVCECVSVYVCVYLLEKGVLKTSKPPISCNEPILILLLQSIMAGLSNFPINCLG